MLQTVTITCFLLLLSSAVTTSAQADALQSVKSSLKRLEQIVQRGRTGCGFISAVLITKSQQGIADTIDMNITTAENIIEVKTKASLVRTSKSQMIGVFPSAKRIVVRRNYMEGDAEFVAGQLHSMLDSVLKECQVNDDKVSGSYRVIVVKPRKTSQTQKVIKEIKFKIDTKTSFVQEVTITYAGSQKFTEATVKYLQVIPDQAIPKHLTSKIETGILDGKGKPVHMYAGYQVSRYE